MLSGLMKTELKSLKVVVAMGMKIPADLRMIECTGDCMFDRSILTGEASFDLLYLRKVVAQFLTWTQSEPVAATVDSTDSNFLEVYILRCGTPSV